jgi:peptide/nickel transport system permease protein
VAADLISVAPVGAAAELSPPGRLRRAWTLLRRQRKAMAGGAVVLFFVFVAVFAPWIAPYAPTEQNFADAMQGPTAAHWLGTDSFGQDILSRIFYGARSALWIGFASVSRSACRWGSLRGCAAGAPNGRRCAWSTGCWRFPS